MNFGLTEFIGSVPDYHELFNITEDIAHQFQTDKNFKCSKCDKLFVQRASLCRHDREVHQAHLTHQCQFCFSKFTRREHLIRHLNRKHQE